MLSVIDRYLLRQILATCLVMTGIGLTVLLLERLLYLFSLVADPNNALGYVGQMLLLLTPHYLSIALPAAFFFGVLLTFGRVLRAGQVVDQLGPQPQHVLPDLREAPNVELRLVGRDDLVALLAEPRDERAADAARGTGDEDLHAVTTASSASASSSPSGSACPGVLRRPGSASARPTTLTSSFKSNGLGRYS